MTPFVAACHLLVVLTSKFEGFELQLYTVSFAIPSDLHEIALGMKRAESRADVRRSMVGTVTSLLRERLPDL